MTRSQRNPFARERKHCDAYGLHQSKPAGTKSRRPWFSRSHREDKGTRRQTALLLFLHRPHIRGFNRGKADGGAGSGRAHEPLAIIAEDPDATKGTFDHWLVWNIPPAESIRENNNAGTAGKNSSGKTGYYPPCPPSGSHRYYFHVYAIDVEINLKAGADKPSLKKAIEAHIIAEGTIMGRYKKANG